MGHFIRQPQHPYNQSLRVCHVNINSVALAITAITPQIWAALF